MVQTATSSSGRFPVRPVDIVHEASRRAFKSRAELAMMLEMYNQFYRDPLFRPIERLGRDERVRATLPIDEAAEALTASVLEARMREAREAIRTELSELVRVTQPIILPGAPSTIAGRSLRELVEEIERDLGRGVY